MTVTFNPWQSWLPWLLVSVVVFAIAWRSRDANGRWHGFNPWVVGIATFLIPWAVALVLVYDWVTARKRNA